jgi:signal transduction histidine kinase
VSVFEPFYRLEPTLNRHIDGTGMGSAIARQLTLAVDAPLSLNNRPGTGLEAALTLKNLRQVRCRYLDLPRCNEQGPGIY